MLKKLFILLTVLWCFWGGITLAIYGQQAPPSIFVPFIDFPPRIDGEIDDIYGAFAQVDRFYQLETGWGQLGTEKTVAYFGFDEKNLYLAVKCYDSKASAIRANLDRRDSLVNADQVHIFIDTFMTRRRGIFLTMNPYGIQMDGLRDDESYRAEMDLSWDTLWYSRGKIYDWGYFIECRVPFKSLRFPAGVKKQEWGILMARFIARKGEYNSSVEVAPDIRGLLSQAANMVIDRVVKPGRNVEAIPTLTGLRNEEQGLKTKFGINLKYGLNSNSTIDLTYNPDFSHIEADEPRIDINQRFALYYPEKRPFFLESSEIFEMPLALFYSRRISQPEWGLKFTSRLGHSEIGLISSRDTASFENLDDISAGGEDSATVNVLRYRYHFKESNHVGFFVSQKHWDEKDNLVFAVDSFYRFKSFALKLQGAYTDKEDKNGNAVYSSFSYNGKHLIADMGYAHYSPDFDPQIGFINRVSYRTLWLSAGYNFYPQTDSLRRIKPAIDFFENFDWQTDDLIDRNFAFSISGQSFKDSFFNLKVTKSLEKYEGIDFDKLFYSLSYSINLTRTFSLGTSFAFGDNINYQAATPYLGYSYTLSLSGNLYLMKGVNCSLGYSNYYLYNELGGHLDLKKNIFRFKNVILFSREISSRIIYEYDDYYARHYLSFLFGYELNPGTLFYLGLSSDYLKENARFRQENFAIFFKFSYFFRM